MYRIAPAMLQISLIVTNSVNFRIDSVYKPKVVHRFLWKKVPPVRLYFFRIISQNTAHPPNSPPICAKLSTFASSMPSPTAETARSSMVE